MPAVLDSCVQSMLAGWKKDPKSRPSPRSMGDGKKQDARSQAFALCTASLKKAGKMEADFDIMLDAGGSGPTILGAAVTNRPVIRGLPEVAIFEQGGEKLLRVPLLMNGKWQSRYGVLEFVRQRFEKMITNFKDDVVGNKISLDDRHNPELGAIAWFLDFIVEKFSHRGTDRDLLVGIAKPNKYGLDQIENERFLYASIEFSPNFKHPLVALEILTDKDLLNIDHEEVAMPESTDQSVRMQQLEDQVKELTATLEQAGELTEKFEAQSAQIEALQLEAQGYRRTARKAQIGQAVSEAESYRDDGQAAHSKMFLDWFNKMLGGDDIGEGDEVIKLENVDDISDTVSYYRRGIIWLSQNLPGSVPMDSPKSERDRARKLDADAGEFDDDDKREMLAAWGGKAKED